MTPLRGVAPDRIVGNARELRAPVPVMEAPC